MFHYPDDGEGIALNLDRPTNGGLAGPRGPGDKNFIDDEYGPAADRDPVVEIAALSEARAHDGEVARE